jgi:hypothetical protein
MMHIAKIMILLPTTELVRFCLAIHVRLNAIATNMIEAVFDAAMDGV